MGVGAGVGPASASSDLLVELLQHAEARQQHVGEARQGQDFDKQQHPIEGFAPRGGLAAAATGGSGLRHRRRFVFCRSLRDGGRDVHGAAGGAKSLEARLARFQALACQQALKFLDRKVFRRAAVGAHQAPPPMRPCKLSATESIIPSRPLPHVPRPTQARPLPGCRYGCPVATQFPWRPASLECRTSRPARPARFASPVDLAAASGTPPPGGLMRYYPGIPAGQSRQAETTRRVQAWESDTL